MLNTDSEYYKEAMASAPPNRKEKRDKLVWSERTKPLPKTTPGSLEPSKGQSKLCCRPLEHANNRSSIEALEQVASVCGRGSSEVARCVLLTSGEMLGGWSDRQTTLDANKGFGPPPRTAASGGNKRSLVSRGSAMSRELLSSANRALAFFSNGSIDRKFKIVTARFLWESLCEVKWGMEKGKTKSSAKAEAAAHKVVRMWASAGGIRGTPPTAVEAAESTPPPNCIAR